ncbi:hypothetical protein [Chitinophaga rhizosphaerae]|uniref:hypothetical protein n=1 Tax=Chitinophaga rhizosphaerae TaxID=1864947 RepID=UPI000F80BE59|nr:hypothetical protein [Chitinophaga rhizosphaerae]
MRNLKKWLFSNMLVRNILTDFGSRSKPYKDHIHITPYFQYKTGPYQSDYFLYFPKEPFARRYYNEIFNKMIEYTGYEIVKYLDFHYSLYEDKPDFLRFLRYETEERMQKSGGAEYKRVQKTTLKWLQEKQKENLEKEAPIVQQGISGTIRDALNWPASSFDVEAIIERVSAPLTAHVQSITNEAEDRFLAIARAFTTGNIQLNDQQHTEKLLQAFYLFSTVKAPGSKTNGLFKEFTATDLAFLLNMHFNEFKSMKPNTVQKKIAAAVEKVRFEIPQVKKLNEALQEFFYS